MTYAIACPDCGVDFVKGEGPQPCPTCGKVLQAYDCGAPPRQEGMGNVSAPFKAHFSFQHGRRLESWSDYRKANKELGLVDTGQRPERSGRGRVTTY